MFLSKLLSKYRPTQQLQCNVASNKLLSRSIKYARPDPKRVLNVAIVGRPNVGKSTLFNRLTNSKMAIVSNVPGTTRDRREERGNIAGLSLNVIDTGGLDDRGQVSLAIQTQVEYAIQNSDIILFVLDARTGVTSVDTHFATWLRKKMVSSNEVKPINPEYPVLKINTSGVSSGGEIRVKSTKDIFLVANKTEGAHMSDQILDCVSESYRLGFGEPILISSAHGDGMADLATVLIQAAQKRGIDDGLLEAPKRLRLKKADLMKVIANKSGNEKRDQNNRLLPGTVEEVETAAAVKSEQIMLPKGISGKEMLTGLDCEPDYDPLSAEFTDAIRRPDVDDVELAENPLDSAVLDAESAKAFERLEAQTSSKIALQTSEDSTEVTAVNANLNAEGQVIRPLEDRLIQLAIMGRPNVGKSTLLNAIIGQERVITGATPGLTRDSVHVEWGFKDRTFRLVDTAGLTRMRPNKMLMEGVKEKKQMSENDKVVGIKGSKSSKEKFLTSSKAFAPSGAPNSIQLPGIQLMNPEADPSQFSYQVSEFALISALNALRFAQVVLLVIESKQGEFSKLELQLARKCLDEGRALVICANKSDMLKRDQISRSEYEAQVKKHTEHFMREFGDVPVIPTSGIAGNGINRLLDTVIATHDAWSRRISTGLLNKWLKDLMLTAPSPRAGGKRINVKYITQVKTRPPTFGLFANADELPGFFERFLKSRMQRDFLLEGVPLRFLVRKTTGAAVNKKLLKHGKHTRRGVGHGEGRGQGPNRNLKMIIKKQRGLFTERRRRDTRIAKSRKSTRGN